MERLRAYKTGNGKWHIDHPTDGVLDYAGEDAEDNVKEIVRIVNSHAEIVAAIKWVLTHDALNDVDLPRDLKEEIFGLNLLLNNA